MSNEWIDLKRDNLPSNILVGNFEWQEMKLVTDKCDLLAGIEYKWSDIKGSPEYILDCARSRKFRYRKPDPKAPTHTEIITLWWKEEHGLWVKVKTYGRYHGEDNPYQMTDGLFVYKDWFTGRESAVIPPESV